jgi:hypothetical protein
MVVTKSMSIFAHVHGKHTATTGIGLGRKRRRIGSIRLDCLYEVLVCDKTGFGFWAANIGDTVLNWKTRCRRESSIVAWWGRKAKFTPPLLALAMR